MATEYSTWNWRPHPSGYQCTCIMRHLYETHAFRKFGIMMRMNINWAFCGRFVRKGRVWNVYPSTSNMPYGIHAKTSQVRLLDAMECVLAFLSANKIR